MERFNQFFKGVALMFLVLLLSSCGVCRRRPVIAVKDSVNTEVREITRFVRDTAYITIPAQSERVVVLDSSYLENDYAVSEAKIDSLGFLHHSLASKERPLSLPYERKEVRKDSIVYMDKVKEIQVPVVTEKPLSWWQQTKLRAFWVLLALTALWAAVKFAPVIRRIIKI